MTLRTDLKALDAAKEIVRIHGGAKSVQLVIGTDDYLTRRAVRNIQSKQEIAKKSSAAGSSGYRDFSWIPEAPPQNWHGFSRISPI